MKTEDKKISFELAKKIDTEHKRLGIVVESEWYHMEHENGDYLGLFGKKHIGEYHPTCNAVVVYPAYDTSELGERILETTRHCLPFVEFYTHEGGDCWKFLNPFTEYREEKIVLGLVSEMTMSEAYGEMYLWFLQNGYIKGA